MIKTRLAGGPFDMGVSVGATHALAIWRVAAESLRRHHTTSCNPEALVRALEQRAQELGDSLPERHAYLKGIEQGSSVPLWKLVLFNCGLSEADWRTIGSVDPGGTVPSGCTIAGFQSTPQGPVIGGNLDDPEWQFIAYESPAKGLRCLQIRLPGYFITWGGMNERGLCVTGASGGPALTGTPDVAKDPAVPPVVDSPVEDVLHRCATAAEAVDLMRDPRYMGNNYLVADAREALLVEKRYDGVTASCISGRDEEALCAGNLRVSDYRTPWFSSRRAEIPPDKLARYERALAVMTRVRERPGVASVEAVLNDHGAGQSDVVAYKSLCHAGSALTLIGIPREKLVRIAEAPACINGYEEIRLHEALGR